jgi:hypothetical protein
MPIIDALIVVATGVAADLPSTAEGIAAALDVPVADVQPGIEFFCKDSGDFYVWNGSAMVQIGGSAEGFTNPMDASGDMIYEDPSLGPARLPIGTSGEVLTVVNGIPTWAATAQSTTFEANGSTLSSDSTINFEGDGTYIAVSNPSAGNVKSALNYSALVTALESSLDGTFDAYGAAGSALSAAESFATSAVATETSRAEAAEALLAPKANPTFTGTVGGITYSMVGADAAGAAATAQANAETYANSVNTSGTAANLSGTPALPNGTSATTQTAGDNTTKIATDAFVNAAVAVETARAEAEEALLVSIINGLGTEFLALAGGTMSGTINMNENLIVWENSSLGIDTSLSRVGPGILGIGTGANGSANGTLNVGALNVSGASTYGGNLTATLGTATPGTSATTAGFDLLQNTTPTVTGAATTVALSTTTAPVNLGSNSWRYTLAATETGAGSNGWLNALVVFSGWTGSATGNNGTFTITASTTTTITVTNPTGTTVNTGTPVAISSAVVNSPILQLAGTINSGTAGALASIADTWSMQVVMGSLVPNPTSTLVLTHAGSTGVAAITTNATSFLGTAAGGMTLGSNAGGVTLECTSGSTIQLSAAGVNTQWFSSYVHFANGYSVGWGSGTNGGNLSDIALTRNNAPASLCVGIQDAGIGAGVVGGSVQATGFYSYGGITLEQSPSVVAQPTVTPTGGSATAYSYEVVALDINMQPIGTSPAGSTSTGVATLTTSAFNTITWTAVQGAFAYAIYRSASSGSPATTGLLYGTTAVTSVAVATAGLTGTYTYASTAINAKLAGQYILIQGCANAANNGFFYCLSSTATSCVLVNPYTVAEASSPASAVLTGGMVPATVAGGVALTALTFVDYGWSANGVAAPTTNTHGGISWLSTYESSATGPALSLDRWSMYQTVASGLNGASTLAFAHTGSSGFASIQLADSGAAPTSAGTAGTAGQFAYHGGLLYFCSVSGAAGSATWNKLTMSSV